MKQDAGLRSRMERAEAVLEQFPRELNILCRRVNSVVESLPKTQKKYLDGLVDQFQRIFRDLEQAAFTLEAALGKHASLTLDDWKRDEKSRPEMEGFRDDKGLVIRAKRRNALTRIRSSLTKLPSYACFNTSEAIDDAERVLSEDLPADLNAGFSRFLEELLSFENENENCNFAGFYWLARLASSEGVDDDLIAIGASVKATHAWKAALAKALHDVCGSALDTESPSDGVVKQNEDDESRTLLGLSPCVRTAYAASRYAQAWLDPNATDEEIYQYLKARFDSTKDLPEPLSSYKLPASSLNFARYCRKARAALKTQKNQPRRGREHGRTVIPRGETD